ncbi:hypothetical protein B0H14DRAFT_2585054 [Mycena olivaceomarginata]|nr:hypothetical protein B0H14DRAFT_2585054 [Mycena olivaceomarginata]
MNGTFLVAKEEEIRETDPDLAFFVHRYRMERGHFDDTHMKRLRKLQFTGTLELGVCRKEPDIPAPMVVNNQQVQREALEAEMYKALAGRDGGDDGWEADNGDKEEEEEELARAIETVVVLATSFLMEMVEIRMESLNRVMAVVEVSCAQVTGMQMDAVKGSTEVTYRGMPQYSQQRVVDGVEVSCA